MSTVRALDLSTCAILGQLIRQIYRNPPFRFPGQGGAAQNPRQLKYFSFQILNAQSVPVLYNSQFCMK